MSQLEAWEMVYVSESFLNSSHGKIECVACHQGDPDASDKADAHKNIIALPSDNASVFCAGCHSDISARSASSLHSNTNGYFKRIENRLGYSIETNAQLMGKFNAECGKCHASCGQCHVSRPVSVNGGFLKGHLFGEPERDNNCTACHGSRVGAEYLGQNEGYAADAHRYKPGGSHCTFCHDGNEMHSSGQLFDYRYSDTDMPRCEDCHDDVKSTNEYHQTHWASESTPSLSCHVCHSQPYKSCNGCHTGGAGITGNSYFKFKIAKNNFNLETANRTYDYVTVRHIPIVPDTYASWGIADLPNFSSEPTWKYTTPHNIQRWTEQTDTRTSGGSCSSKCHKSGTYYLTTSDLEDFEKDANKNIVLDEEINH
ncbi:hypothetical protein JW960_05155 [candidate division KSB1 bacterium]|nr:hypothetical protein [candidate division KSB1 bacterium]